MKITGYHHGGRGPTVHRRTLGEDEMSKAREDERLEREARLQPGGPMPFLERRPQPDTIWRCPVCGYLTDEEGDSSCPRCLGDIGDDEGDLWQPYIPAPRASSTPEPTA